MILGQLMNMKAQNMTRLTKVRRTFFLWQHLEILSDFLFALQEWPDNN